MFVGDQIAFYLASRGHHSDIGSFPIFPSLRVEQRERKLSPHPFLSE